MFKINTIYAFVGIDDEGDEGLCSMFTNIGALPMVGADWDRVAALREAAQTIADVSGMTITLTKFSVRETVEVITPGNKTQLN